jgi:hypothetical protein
MKSMATALSAPLTPSSSSTVADALLGYQQGSASSAGKIRCCEETTDVRGVRTLVAQNHLYLPSPVSPANREKKESRRADSNRLSLLQLRVCGHGLLRVAWVCKSRIGNGFSTLSRRSGEYRVSLKPGTASQVRTPSRSRSGFWVGLAPLVPTWRLPWLRRAAALRGPLRPLVLRPCRS